MPKLPNIAEIEKTKPHHGGTETWRKSDIGKAKACRRRFAQMVADQKKSHH